MSVYRTLSAEDREAVRRAAGVATLDDIRPIAAGIENSNWFVTLREGPAGRGTAAVLTLLESVPADELPFFIAITDALYAAGLPVPVARTLDHGRRFLLLQGRPALLVPRLPGSHCVVPAEAQCAAAGAMLARLHVAGARMPVERHRRDADWWPSAMALLAPSLSADVRAELSAALGAATQAFARCAHLPHGLVHGDFFRDNVLLDGDGVTGVLDFFHATHDLLAWDIAIALNDWSIVGARPDAARATAFLGGYQRYRPLADDEYAELPALRRAAAARFWLSRLLAPGHPKDPEEMRAWWRALG